MRFKPSHFPGFIFWGMLKIVQVIHLLICNLKWVSSVIAVILENRSLMKMSLSTWKVGLEVRWEQEKNWERWKRFWIPYWQTLIHSTSSKIMGEAPKKKKKKSFCYKGFLYKQCRSGESHSGAACHYSHQKTKSSCLKQRCKILIGKTCIFIYFSWAFSEKNM